MSERRSLEESSAALYGKKKRTKGGGKLAMWALDCNTDLNQSFKCWNDFIDCDFTGADLTCCDLRASVFEGCSFVRCKLIGADLRWSDFEGCDFPDADLTGARADGDTDLPEISEEQYDQIDWQDEGPEPPGG
jgi:uncharacterized protein YjbI with pentapeptide repeats